MDGLYVFNNPWAVQSMEKATTYAAMIHLGLGENEQCLTRLEACLESGWEFNAHAWEQIPMHKVDDQRENIRRTIEAIESFAGYRPRGWFGPGLTETFGAEWEFAGRLGPASNTSRSAKEIAIKSSTEARCAPVRSVMSCPRPDRQ